MGKKLIIANWKMNLNVHEASMFVHKLAELVEVHNDVDVVLAPTALALQSVSLQVNHHQFKLASQNFYWRDKGAYTGEVSATQLRGLVQYALVGHSERRHVFGETNKDIRSKVQAAFRNEITPVLCIGETATERSLGETDAILHDQLMAGLSNITSEEAKNIVIAYEPVWAIGSGKNALPRDVEAAVASIRKQVRHLFGKATGDSIRVLYGGSVTVDNVSSYLKVEGVDGLLVGSTSLDVRDFAAIVNSVHELLTKEKKK